MMQAKIGKEIHKFKTPHLNKSKLAIRDANEFVDLSSVNILSALHPNRHKNIQIIRQFDPSYRKDIIGLGNYKNPDYQNPFDVGGSEDNGDLSPEMIVNSPSSKVSYYNDRGSMNRSP